MYLHHRYHPTYDIGSIENLSLDIYSKRVDVVSLIIERKTVKADHHLHANQEKDNYLTIASAIHLKSSYLRFSSINGDFIYIGS